jgi:hypothetical protein
MAEPPKPEHRRASQAELESLYEEHNFDNKLSQCKRDQFCPRTSYRPDDMRHTPTIEYKEGAKFRDAATNDPIAVIFWYTDIAGTVTRSIRMLRIDNVIYDAKLR